MIRRVAYAPSKKPYALNLGSFRVGGDGFARLDALWVGRKDRRTYVSLGELRDYGVASLEEFLATFDPRYGGDCRARWNGINLWAPGLPALEYAQTVAQLDAALTLLPDVPAGFDGWYSLK